MGFRKYYYKASGGDGIPVELFQVLKDDAVKILHSICQKIWKTQQWPQDWKMSAFIQIPKKGNAKECSNYHTIAPMSHASKVMLKILQARLQRELWTSRCSNWIYKRQRNQRSNWTTKSGHVQTKEVLSCHLAPCLSSSAAHPLTIVSPIMGKIRGRSIGGWVLTGLIPLIFSQHHFFSDIIEEGSPNVWVLPAYSSLVFSPLSLPCC